MPRLRPRMVQLFLWLPVAVYMAAIFLLSSLSSLAGIPGAGLPDWIPHLAAYAGLAVVTLRATAGGRWPGVGAASVIAAWVIATLYGATDEWHQSFVPGRMAEMRDLVADAIGAALGLGAAWAWGIIRRSS